MKRTPKHLPAGRYRLELDEATVQTLVDGLAAMPLARALPALQAIQRQVQAQDVERAAEAAAVQRRAIEAELEPVIRNRLRTEMAAARVEERLGQLDQVD
jgi:hypothetical protein